MAQRSQHVAARAASKHVAVIGAGAAGLVAARELRAEGHVCTVFEQGCEVGGTWVIDPKIEDDRLGQRHDRTQVHSSMYSSLRVNLPRELMSFSDFPFLPRFMLGMSHDSRRFCHHSEVLRYLQAFTERYSLRDVIQFDTVVDSVRPADDAAAAHSSTNGGTNGRTPAQNGRRSYGAAQEEPEDCRWEVTVHRRGCHGSARTHTYDAVVVCNGHYTVPRIPEIQGFETYPGTCEHSHNYRVPEQYKDLTVLVVGAHASGEDIARDVASEANQVIMSAKTWMKEEFADQPGPFGDRNNIYRRPWLSEMRHDGTLVFEDESSLRDVDIVMFCTGYHYSFPFLSKDIIESSRSHVRPLYQHMFTPRFGASLSFIGLTFKIVPFPQFELQAKFIARLLSGRSALPPAEAMARWNDEHEEYLASNRIKDRHVHKQGELQWEYNDWLAEQCGDDVPRTPEWRVDLWRDARALKRTYEPEQYRDEWDNEHSVAKAHAAFEELDNVHSKAQEAAA